MSTISNTQGVIIGAHRIVGGKAIIEFGDRKIKFAVKKPLSQMRMLKRVLSKLLRVVTPYAEFKIKLEGRNEPVTVDVRLTDLEKSKLISHASFHSSKTPLTIQEHVQDQVKILRDTWKISPFGTDKAKHTELAKVVMLERQLAFQALSTAERKNLEITSSGRLSAKVQVGSSSWMHIARHQCRSLATIQKGSRRKGLNREILASASQELRAARGYSAANEILDAAKLNIESKVNGNLYDQLMNGSLLLEYDSEVRITHSENPLDLGPGRRAAPKLSRSIGVEIKARRAVPVSLAPGLIIQPSELKGNHRLRREIDRQMKALLMKGIAVSDESVKCVLCRTAKGKLVPIIAPADEGILKGWEVMLAAMKIEGEEVPVVCHLQTEKRSLADTRESIESELNRTISRLYGTKKTREASALYSQHSEETQILKASFELMSWMQEKPLVGSVVHVEVLGKTGFKRPVVTMHGGTLLKRDPRHEFSNLTQEQQDKSSPDLLELELFQKAVSTAVSLAQSHEELSGDLELLSIYREAGLRLPDVTIEDLARLESRLADLQPREGAKLEEERLERWKSCRALLRDVRTRVEARM